MFTHLNRTAGVHILPPALRRLLRAFVAVLGRITPPRPTRLAPAALLAMALCGAWASPWSAAAEQSVFAVGSNHSGQCDVSGWSGITSVAVGGIHVAGLKSDGTVVAAGDQQFGRCNVSEWRNVTAIAAGNFHTAGLRSDGTVVVSSAFGGNVSGWRGITAIAAGYCHTVGLKGDGTVVVAGDNEFGQAEVSEWTGITAIAAGDYTTVGLRSDGTVVATGQNDYGQCNVAAWSGIAAISACYRKTVGLRGDGTVVAVGRSDFGQCDVSGWSGIVAIAAGGFHTVGLKGDGSVVARGRARAGAGGVEDWREITAIAAGFANTLGLRNPGPPAQLAFRTQPATCSAGASITPAVQVDVRDTRGFLSVGANNLVTLALGENPGGANLSGTCTVAAVNGIATFPDVRVDEPGSGYALVATSPGLVGAESASFGVSLPPAQLRFSVEPADATAGTSISPAVQVTLLDAEGNLTLGTSPVTVTLAANPVGGTLSGTHTANAVNGVAAFPDLSVDRSADGYTLMATAAGVPAAISADFSIVPGSATQLTFTTQPTDTPAAAVITPPIQVAVQDLFGNTVPDATDAITVDIGTNPAAGTLSGARTTNAVSGLAVFGDLSIDRVGAGYTLTASAAGLAGVTSAAFQITDSTPSLAAQPDRAGAEGDTIELQLSGAEDADGDALTWSASGLPPGLTLSAAGLVTGTLAPTAAGGSPYTVTVTVSDDTPGGPGGDSVSQTFTWTVTDVDTTPTLAAQQPRENIEGEDVDLQMAGAVDPDNDPLAWSATGLPPGLSISAGGRIAGTLPYTAAADSPYSVTVTVTDDTPGGAAGDTASQSFTWTVRRPTITVTAPNGGDTWTIGSSVTVSWIHTGVFDTVKVQLSRDGGATWQTLSHSAPNRGTLTRAISGPATSAALVRVSGANDVSVSDTSDAPFTILKEYGVSPAAFKIADGVAPAGGPVALPIRYSAQGGDVAIAVLDLIFDPTQLTFVRVTSATPGVTVAASARAPGRVRVVIRDFPPSAWDWVTIAVPQFRAADSVVPSGSTEVKVVLPGTLAPGVEVSPPIGSLLRASATWSRVRFGADGDLNHNGLIDVGDVQVMVNVLIGDLEFDPAEHDLNGNTVLDAGDLQAVVNLYLGSTLGATAAADVPTDALSPQDASTSILLGFRTGDVPLTAIAFDLKQGALVSSVALSTSRADLRVSKSMMPDGRLRVLLYSNNCTPLPTIASFRLGLASSVANLVPLRPSTAGSIGADGARPDGALSVAEFVPAAPAALRLVSSVQTAVVLAWNAVAGATGLELERKGSTGSFARIAAPATTARSYTDRSVSAGTSYTYRLRAANGQVVSAYSSELPVTIPCAAPRGLSARANSTAEVLLSWTGVTGATTYEVFRSGSEGWAAVPLASVSAANGATQHYRDTRLGGATGAISYRVRARNRAGVSPHSNVATLVVLPAPMGLIARAVSSTQVDLAWSFAAGVACLRFSIERSLDGGARWSPLGSAPAGATGAYSDRIARPGAIRYRVSAVNAGGHSSYALANITVMAAPTALKVGVLPGRQAKLEWVVTSTGQSGFRIERFDGSALTPSATIAVAGATTTTKTLVLPAGRYAFTVRAIYGSISTSSPSNKVGGIIIR